MKWKICCKQGLKFFRDVDTFGDLYPAEYMVMAFMVMEDEREEAQKMGAKVARRMF